MNDKDFFNLDDILADFSSYSSNLSSTDGQDSAEPSQEKPEPVSAPETFENPVKEDVFQFPKSPESPVYSQKESADFSASEFKHVVPTMDSVSDEENPFTATASPDEFNFQPVQQPKAAPPQQPRRPAAPSRPRTQSPEEAAIRRNAAAKRKELNFDPEIMGMTKKAVSCDRTQMAPAMKRPAAQKPQNHRTSPAVEPSYQKEAPEPRSERRGLFGTLGIVFAVLSLFVVSWVFVNVHPDSGTTVGSSLKSKVNMVEKFDGYANNAASDALGELAYIPKIYTIAEDVNVAPKPNPANYGSTTDPQVVMQVIADASDLLGDQKVAFNPDATFVAGSEIKYYRDDTILAIAWKEDNYGKCCNCAEVKIAHGSQIRRKVAGDTYSVGKRYYATDMAKECNAVVAINGDFYDFRPIGITVFQRELFRFNPGKLDSCHINSKGQFIFTYADELTDEESTRQFIKDNDIIFSLSFGPILIDNGEFRPIAGYPIGEVNTTYSRSAIGTLDDLHYMLMTVNYDVGYATAATLNEIGRYMEEKGCQQAYALDGGQTSVLMMNGELVNHVDYGNERTMSDIIYFATAIPDEEAAK